jgi:GntR family transcriptional regulator
MEFHEKRAIYLQIGDRICENILAQTWREGNRIPSIRELAVDMEVNPNTVMRTYAYLQELGIIHNRRGIGYFVASDAKQRTLELKRRAFIEEELPRLFKSMDLLGLSCADLEGFYKGLESGGKKQTPLKHPGEKQPGAAPPPN